MNCVEFLQWALPRMRMQWAGFRKVHNQVCKRIRRRLLELEVNGFSDYQAYLKSHPDEWKALDRMCIITISRFYRDRKVFNTLRKKVLPELAEEARVKGRNFNGLSIGCASGEEPYTLAIIWEEDLKEKFPRVKFPITATELDSYMLKRARRGCYAAGSIRELPSEWEKKAFTRKRDQFCIRPAYKNHVNFLQQDIRLQIPEMKFDLVLCRNLIAFYYEKSLQVELFRKIHSHMNYHGVLVLGSHETLPPEVTGFASGNESEPMYSSR